MKFAKLFQIYKDEDNENYFSIEEVFEFLQKNDGKANKYNIKRSLQAFQGGQKIICGKESVTVGAVLKYFFSYSNSSKTCATVVKNIEQELLSSDSNFTEKSSLELYKQIAKNNIHQYTGVFEQIDIPEQDIVTLVVEHKPNFTPSEWKRICWFENSFSRDLKLQQSDLPYEEVLELKYCKYQSLLTLVDCSKKWVCESETQIQQKSLRYQASDKENQVRITSGQGHIAIILDSDIKSLIDIYCPDSIGHTVCFELTKSENVNAVCVVLFQNQELEVSFDDLCSRIFYMLKRRHNVYLESVSLIEAEELKDFVSEDGNVYRFLLRDSVETKQLKKISNVWQSGALIDGTLEYEGDIQCQICYKGVLSKPLSTDNFNIVQEWYLEIPIETQVLLENFINKDTVRRHKDPDSFVKTKLEKLYSIYDVLLNLHNKKFTGVFQKSNSSKLLIEYKSVGSVFDITSAAGATLSLSQAENQVKSGSCKDLCYYNTYLRDNSLAYQTVGGENKSCVNLRSCHLILMLDNLVRLQYIADPNPSEHRSKQLCTLPITLQGLPLDSTITQEWHLADCNGDLNCSCKQPVLLKKDDIQRVLLKSDQNEKMLYTQFFNLMTFGYPVLWKKLPDDLLDHVEGRKVEQGTTVVNGIDQSSALYEIEDNAADDHEVHDEVQMPSCLESDDRWLAESKYQDDKSVEEFSELDFDLVNALQSIDTDFPIAEELESIQPGDFSDDEPDLLPALEKSIENMSIMEEDSAEETAHSIKRLLKSFGFTKNKVPPLLTRHPPPAVGRDDDPSKIREILDDILVKMGYEADPNRCVNRILCGPDNKIGKCLLDLLNMDKKYQVFLPEFPLLHLRKSKINILFSSYGEAGLVQILRIMRHEDQEEWAKLISIQHIDMATKHVRRIALALHLAFLISFMDYIEPEALQEFLNDMETENSAEISSKWAAKFQDYLTYGSARNATFALHVDMMRHCDDVIAISLAERLGGKDGYGLLLAAVKNSLLFSFVNNASAYAPYCVRLLCCHYSAGYFHRCLKEELYTTPFKGSNKNFACDTKREIDHLDALKGFRSGSTVNSATCRMSLIDSLNVTKQHQPGPHDEQDDDDKLGWELTEVDLNHIFPAAALILKRQAMSLVENVVPYNVYSSTPLVLPSSILDSCSEDVGKYLLFRYLQKENLFGLDLSDVSKVECLQGPSDLVARARRSKGVTIKRVTKSSVQPVRTERQEKEEKRLKEVSKETKIVSCFSSENNTCQALVNADSTKPKVMKSLGIPRALKALVQICGKAESLDKYIALNLSFIPRNVINSMKICTIEFAGMKFKTGSVKTGREYLLSVQRMLNGLIGKSNNISKIVICEEKYGYTPDVFKAGTREQRKTKKENDVSHLVTHDRIISNDVFNKDIITRTDTGKKLISTYVAKNVCDLTLNRSVSVVVDSELIVKKDCECTGICKCADFCIPIIYTVKTRPECDETNITQTLDVRQRKGEAEMAVADWLIYVQGELVDGDAVVCFVTSGDIDAVYIHLDVVSRLWAKDETNGYRFPVYVVLQKQAGKVDVYNITALLSLFEEHYKDPAIGSKLAYTLCIGGNDFVPKLFSKSHDTVCKTVLESTYFRNSLYSVNNGRLALNIDVYIELVKFMFTPKRKQGSYIPYEEVRAITIAKTKDKSKKSGYKHTDPRKWLPPQSAVERLADLIQLQIEYLQSAGFHDHRMPNFRECKCLKENASGEIEYDFGEESHFQSVEDLPCVTVKSQKRSSQDTPQGGARRKRQLTSTPKAKLNG